MRACAICNKKSQVQKSGAHNYGGGWAYRAVKTRWVGEPNLHSQRVTYMGVRKTMRLCTKCLRKVRAEMEKNVSKVVKVTEAAKAEVKIPVAA